MVTVYLWLHGSVPVATEIHIVCCLLSIIRDGQSNLSHLKGTFCHLLEQLNKAARSLFYIGLKTQATGG